MDTRVWLITGAGRGFGQLIADVAEAAGDVVVRTARDLASLPPEGVVLDVGDAQSVDDAVAETIRRHGRIDVLVNNAGHGLIGAAEELTESELVGLLDTNLLGVFRTTRAVLPHMRARGAGHIVQMSSVGGVVANPGHCAYATTKFALEGFSEALAGEVAPFGIRVTIVEPGPFRTEFAGSSIRFADAAPAYADTPAGRLRTNFPHQDGVQPNDPRRAAEIIVATVADADAPMRLPLGPEAIDRIRSKLQGQLADLDRWEATGRDTRYDGTVEH